jgi:hypothetical protein
MAFRAGNRKPGQYRRPNPAENWHYRPTQNPDARPGAHRRRWLSDAEATERARAYFAEHHPDLAAALAARLRAPLPDPEPMRWPEDPPDDTRRRIRVLLRRYRIRERERRRAARKRAYRDDHRDLLNAAKRQRYAENPPPYDQQKRADRYQARREAILAAYRERREDTVRIRDRQCRETDPGIEERWARICRREHFAGWQTTTPRGCERLRAREAAERTLALLRAYDERSATDLLLARYLCTLRRIAGTAGRADPDCAPPEQ